ncbi:putative LRR receptor-like serine/threonine-protein kinase [Hordeum vulgare]|nr:putative LRR receptor-like serine/threonine-protein kinase [Hordeum vulgare]
MKEEVEEQQLQQQEEEPEVMEEDGPEEEAPGFSMAEAEAEFAVAQSEEMAEQQSIRDSFRDVAEMGANRHHIRQRQTEADTLFDKLDAEIKAEEAIYPLEGTKIVHISDEE